MSSIKKINIFPNDEEISIKVVKELERKLQERGYILSKDSFDLAIAVGGDGSFLQMVRKCDFDEKINYIGVHTGTLGFSQEIDPNKIDDFLLCLEKDACKEEQIGIQETSIYSLQNIKKYYSLNEIVIRDINLKTAHLEININDEILENYVGDGVCICTSFGSTAYNYSLGGSIVDRCFDTLQITPIAPINHNEKSSLKSSYIGPGDNIISVKPENRTKNLLLSIDDEVTNLDQNTYIETTIGRHIKCLCTNNYSHTKRIHEKYTR